MPRIIRSAIVEDNREDRELLIRSLRRYESEYDQPFNIREFSDGEDLVTNYSADYDLILMDIEMTFMDGMTAARRIREKDPDVVLLFVTNAPQYAIEGYKVRAVDYILKPISWFTFSESLRRALEYIRADREDSITISLRDGKTRLKTERICYVEVQDHQIIFNTLDGRYVARGTIREVEEQLPPERFCRCNRCYIVNLKYVEAYQGYNLTVNGDVLQVSRRQRKSLLDAMNVYMNGASK